MAKSSIRGLAGSISPARWFKNNAEFWLKKLSKNKERDATVTATLQERGWLVVRIWECELARESWSAVAEKIVNGEW